MCIRTTATYGCGHVFKSTRDCYSSACPGVDRCRCEKVGDCRDCRSKTTKSSRGQDQEGKIRYRIKKVSAKDKSNSSSEEILPIQYNVSGGASPWAPQVEQEKTWESPHRKRADEAWLSEHEDRISDLQDRLEKVKVSDKQSKPKSKSKHAKEDYDYDSYDQDGYDFIEHRSPKRPLQGEVRRQLATRMERSNSQRHQDRQHSHDSLPDSMPSYRSSPKLRQPAAFNVVNAYPESTQEYDYYNSDNVATTKSPHHHKRPRHQGHHRAHTDPYIQSNIRRLDSTYEIEPPPPPVQMPLPGRAVYDYYSPHASPPSAQYVSGTSRYEQLHPSPPSRPPYYVTYRGL